MACRHLSRSLSLCLRISSQRACSSLNKLLRQNSIGCQNPSFAPAVTWNQLSKRLYSSPASTCFNIQDEDDFQKRVLESSTPVIVDFHATWCGPCKLLAPRLEKIVDDQKGEVVLAKVDVDDNVEIAMQYGVESVPTVIAVSKGVKVDQFIGLQSDDIIESFVEKLKH